MCSNKSDKLFSNKFSNLFNARSASEFVSQSENNPFDVTSPPAYQEINQILQQQQIALSPTEFQGLLCGLICAGCQTNQLRIYSEELLNKGLPLPSIINALADCLSQNMRLLLPQGDIFFRVLLPARKTLTDFDCIRALSDWAKWFSIGFKLVFSDLELPERHQEMIMNLCVLGKLSGSENKNDIEELIPQLEYLTRYLQVSAAQFFRTFALL